MRAIEALLYVPVKYQRWWLFVTISNQLFERIFPTLKKGSNLMESNCKYSFLLNHCAPLNSQSFFRPPMWRNGTIKIGGQRSLDHTKGPFNAEKQKINRKPNMLIEKIPSNVCSFCGHSAASYSKAMCMLWGSRIFRVFFSNLDDSGIKVQWRVPDFLHFMVQFWRFPWLKLVQDQSSVSDTFLAKCL